MKITIGELVNELMLYSRNIEINMAGPLPFLKADLGDNDRYTRGHIYIVQVAEHQYSICDYHDDIHGNRYLPTQNLDHPFIKEKRLSQLKFGLPVEDIEKHSIVLNAGYLAFLNHFYRLLFQYGVTKVNPTVFYKQITDPEVIPLPSRVAKGLESIFKGRNIPDPTILDLITLVKNPSEVFTIRGIKEKDIKILEAKFESIGIILTMQKNVITDIHFEKIKIVKRGNKNESVFE